jgi:hypothetical protein
MTPAIQSAHRNIHRLQPVSEVLHRVLIIAPAPKLLRSLARIGRQNRAGFPLWQLHPTTVPLSRMRMPPEGGLSDFPDTTPMASAVQTLQQG